MSIVDRAETAFESRELAIARWINVLALFGLIGVLAGSLFLQFGIGEQPCPLCLVQRSGMIAIAVGPIMNLLWGMRPGRHRAAAEPLSVLLPQLLAELQSVQLALSLL